jgi:soluble cytochrome b562
MSILKIMEKVKTDILSEISTLTRVIEQDFPELLKYLDETRSTLSQGEEGSTIDMKSLENYRDSLKELIQRYDKKQK